tara:strand:- start:179 stop:484 length:306 start_codon:yes stop_codon:yes gene_type:complete
MVEFIVGLFFGYIISGDLGEPVPSQIITYTDSGRVVKVYRSSAFSYRYYPDSYGWNRNNDNYFETRYEPPRIYSKSVVIKRKPKKSGEFRRKKGGGKGKKK